jgi:catechol 2,3-dioxygenase-like lactoylglutathione lyase family enzyme
MADTKSSTRITEVGAVMIPVSDQDKAIEFYTEKLGFEKRSDTPFGDGNRWVEVAPAGADTVIALVEPRPQDSVGIEVPVGLNSSDVEADHADLKDKGVDVDDEVSRMGDPVPPMFWFRDQDGNTLMIVERTE